MGKRIFEYTYAEFKAACSSSESIIEAANKLGMNDRKNSYSAMKQLSHLHDVPLPMWDKRKSTKALIKNHRYTDEEYFVGSSVRNGTATRKRMQALGISYICAECGQEPFWHGKPLTLQVDHIDGNKRNNVLSNLRFLCANCHTQTETFGAKNAALSRVICVCGRKVSQLDDATICIHGSTLIAGKASCIDCKAPCNKYAQRCNSCENANRVASGTNLKTEYPSVEEIILGVEKFGYLRYAKEIGVSDNAVRKFLKGRGVDPLPKRKYK
jgi:hypothetical protein